LLWQKTYGGDGNDEGPRVIQTADGGFLVAGRSDSDVSGNKATLRYGTQWQDYWVIRLDSQGDELWERTFGGNGMEYSDDVIQTLDGGFVVAGSSSSGPDGNKTAPLLAPASMGTDLWLVRLDAAGQMVWDQTYSVSNYT